MHLALKTFGFLCSTFSPKQSKNHFRTWLWPVRQWVSIERLTQFSARSSCRLCLDSTLIIVQPKFVIYNAAKASCAVLTATFSVKNKNLSFHHKPGVSVHALEISPLPRFICLYTLVYPSINWRWPVSFLEIVLSPCGSLVSTHSRSHVWILAMQRRS